MRGCEGRWPLGKLPAANYFLFPSPDAVPAHRPTMAAGSGELSLRLSECLVRPP